MAHDGRAPRILITGKDGQVGFELQRSLHLHGTVVAAGRDACDLARPDAIRMLIEKVQPDIIVNPAAYTEVDKAESEPDLAYAVNALAPQVLAEEAAKRDALLVHYSTDYVFDGDKSGAYVEQDAAAPQSVYGKSKLAGERAIRATSCKHLILRTSWIYGTSGSNFLKTILRLAQERHSLRIVADQIGAPTSAALISDVTAQVLRRYMDVLSPEREREPIPFGIYHLAAAGETSWHGYAQFVVRLAEQLKMPLKLHADGIAPIATEEYPLPARRPANSRLNTDKLRSTFDILLPPWQAGVAEVLNRLVKT